MTDDELEQKIADLRALAEAQEQALAIALKEKKIPVSTSDITGLAQLTVRIDSLERVLEHRRTRRAPPRRQTRRGQNRTSS